MATNPMKPHHIMCARTSRYHRLLDNGHLAKSSVANLRNCHKPCAA